MVDRGPGADRRASGPKQVDRMASRSGKIAEKLLRIWMFRRGEVVDRVKSRSGGFLILEKGPMMGGREEVTKEAEQGVLSKLTSEAFSL